MSENKSIAVTHPGKIGDVIYAMPAIKKISQIYGKVDFFTSSYCEPLRKLFEYQSYINSFNIPSHYQIRDFGCGGQPWDMNIQGYEKVFQLGFRQFPRKSIDQVFCENAGVPYTDFLGTIECPGVVYSSQYIVIAPRKDEIFKQFFLDFIDKCPILTVQIGTTDEYIGKSIDATGDDFLKTASLISGAKGYFGVLSSLGGIAQSFNIPKVLLGANAGWEMSHVRRTSDNFYPNYPPKLDEVFSFLGL